ncbi:proteasome assembly chaperone 2 [Lipomyces orientalis]|uniref:Proteasome assembly chaperone 2 n=1 Tax=Lipomyces orientalis TaxID=1233043 RepID=A0ACC3TJS2_9ASCO
MMELPNKGTILILPAVSSANVPQLAVDLLVHSFRIPFYSLLDHGGLLYPFAGPREDPAPLENDTATQLPKNGIASSLEVYHNSSVTCLIQRSPTLPASRGLFISKVLLPFIQQNKFSRILLLSSTDASRRSDPGGQRVTSISLYDRSFQGISTPTILDLSRKIAKLSVDESIPQPEYEEYALPPRLPGSGITLQFLKVAVTHNLPTSSVILYVYEGDNFADAYYMAEMALSALEIASPPAWTPPPSWEGVYGRKQKVGLEYGLYG